MWIYTTRRNGGEGMKGTEVPEMKDARTMSPSSSTCDPFYLLSTASSATPRSFQPEDPPGTKDPATGMILIEYDYLPSSSGCVLPSHKSRPGLRVRHAANRARGNFLSHRTDGRADRWKRELDPERLGSSI